jgi:hypothetical protein
LNKDQQKNPEQKKGDKKSCRELGHGKTCKREAFHADDRKDSPHGIEKKIRNPQGERPNDKGIKPRDQ